MIFAKEGNGIDPTGCEASREGIAMRVTEWMRYEPRRIGKGMWRQDLRRNRVAQSRIEWPSKGKAERMSAENSKGNVLRGHDRKRIVRATHREATTGSESRWMGSEWNSTEQLRKGYARVGLER